MKRVMFIFCLAIFISFTISAQVTVRVDSANQSVLVIEKDSRLDALAAIEAKGSPGSSNNPPPNFNPRAAKGYRLMVLSTNDRATAMKVRSLLLQHFPEQKAYMSFQAPNIKIKFGNFLSRDEALRYKRQILGGKIVTTNVYLVPETIEVKPQKGDRNDDKEKDKAKSKKKDKTDK